MAYIKAQGEKIAAIAEERQEIVEKRLKNLEPLYPHPELQTTLRTDFIIGVSEEI